MNREQDQHRVDLDALDFLDRLRTQSDIKIDDTKALHEWYAANGGECPFVFTSLVEQMQARQTLRAALLSNNTTSQRTNLGITSIQSRVRSRKLIQYAIAAVVLIGLLGVTAYAIVPKATTDQEVQYLSTLESLHKLPDSAFNPTDSIVVDGRVLATSPDIKIVGVHTEEDRTVYRLQHSAGFPITFVADTSYFKADPDNNAGTVRKIAGGVPCLCLPHGECHVIYWNEGKMTFALVDERKFGYPPLLDVAGHIRRLPIAMLSSDDSTRLASRLPTLPWVYGVRD